MNLFNIPEPSGGHKLKAHDLNFIYDSLKAGFTALSLERGNAVLYGLAYTRVNSTTVNYSSGWVMMGGEIYYYSGLGNINTSVITDPVLVPYEVAMTPSPRIMADSTTKNIHFSRVVRIENRASQPVKYSLKELKNYGDAFHTIDAVGAGTDFVYTSPWVTSGVTDFATLKVRIVGEELEIQGVAKTAAYADGTVFVLPDRFFGPNYRPVKVRSLVVAAKTVYTNPSDTMMLVDVDPTGIVSVNGSGGSGDLYLMFNHKIPLMY